HVRVGAHARARGDGTVPDHARHIGSDRRVPERTRLLQRAALQQQKSGAARVSRRRTWAARMGEPQRSHGALLRVLRSLPEGPARAEVDDRRCPVPAETGNSKLKTQNSKLRIEAGKFGFNF